MAISYWLTDATLLHLIQFNDGSREEEEEERERGGGHYGLVNVQQA